MAEDVLLALGTCLLMIMEAFDSSARVAHASCGLTGSPRNAAWQRRWWRKLNDANPTLAGIVRPADLATKDRERFFGAPENFSIRELEVIELVAAGLSNKAIATRLHLSPRTVEKHVERLLAKTNSANRAQLATHAVRPAPAP